MRWLLPLLLGSAWVCWAGRGVRQRGLHRVFHRELFRLHGVVGDEELVTQWLDHLSLSSTSFVGEAEVPMVVCGDEEVGEEKWREVLGGERARRVDVVLVDHATNEVCHLLHSSHEEKKKIESRHDVTVHVLPPLLKIQSSVMHFMTTSAPSRRFPGKEFDEALFLKKNDGTQNENAKGKDLGQERDEGFEMIVQFMPGTNHSRDDVEEVMKMWKTSESESVNNDNAIDFSLRKYSELSGKSLNWENVRQDSKSKTSQATPNECKLPLTAKISHSDDLQGGAIMKVVNMKDMLTRHDNSLQSNHCFVALVEMLSQHPNVLSISVDTRPRILNYNARGILQSGSPQSSPLTSAGIIGEGQVVGVADTGLDDLSCFFYDTSGRYSTRYTSRDGSVEPYRRKVVQYNAYADSAEGVAGHGTHVTGSIVGNSIFSDFSAANGVAPGGKVAFFDIEKSGNSYLAIPESMGSLLFSKLYSAGARVMSNSWGGGTSYSSSCYETDYFAYHNPDTLIVFAAGNSGIYGEATTLAPCLAKNSLCVGSFGTTADDDDTFAGSANREVSFFSSMGPTPDGRIKPDVVSPGFKISSAMAGGGSTQSCGVYDTFGTSMATPVAAGGALLLRDYFSGLWSSVCRSSYSYCKSFVPSGYLLKALIIHSAEAVSMYSNPMFDHKTTLSSFSLTQTPDSVQGYGAVNLHSILPLTVAERNVHDLYVADKVYVASKSTIMLRVSVTSSNKPLRVTLVWYDRPSVAGSTENLLFMNLDLKVVSVSSNTKWYGNGVNSDTTNPQEQVSIETPVVDTYNIFITNTGQYNIHAGIVVSCRGVVSQEASSLNVPEPLSDDGATPSHMNEAEQHAPGMRGSTVDSEDVKVVTLSAGTTGANTVAKSFDFAETLEPMASSYLGNFEISEANSQLISVDVKLNASLIVGSEAYIFAVVIHTPNGEILQLGGYTQYVAVDRFWQRMAPVHFTQLANTYDGSPFYSYTRDISPMGIDQIGTFDVYVQLLYSAWETTTYRGSVDINFAVVTPSPTPHPTPRPVHHPTAEPGEDIIPDILNDIESGQGTTIAGIVLFGVSFAAVVVVAVVLARRRRRLQTELSEAVVQSSSDNSGSNVEIVSPLKDDCEQEDIRDSTVKLGIISPWADEDDVSLHSGTDRSKPTSRLGQVARNISNKMPSSREAKYTRARLIDQGVDI